MALEDVMDVLDVATVGRGFVGDCGRLSLYHCSASGFVLNFLNLAPGYPWTCDWASSLQNPHRSATDSKRVRTESRCVKQSLLEYGH